MKEALDTLRKVRVHLSAVLSVEWLVIRRMEWSGEMWRVKPDTWTEVEDTPCLRISCTALSLEDRKTGQAGVHLYRVGWSSSSSSSS